MLTINLDDNLQIKQQQQAEKNGNTIEQEIKKIIYISLIDNEEKSLHLADKIKQRLLI